MATTTRSRKSTAANREQAHARMTALLDQLAAFQEDVDDDDLAMARIAVWAERYSENNAALIVMQAPNATEIRGYRDWQAHGRQVRKGEAGIRILAPAGQGDDTEAKPATDDAPAVDGKPGRRFFRLIAVFDRAQTDPIGE